MVYRMVLLGLFSGCAGTPGVDVLEPGSGPENEAPLLPLALGTRMGPFVVDGSGRGPAYRRVPHLTLGVEEYLVEEDSTYLVWTPPLGELERPLLVAPSTVRVGMQWRSDPGGDVTPSIFEVISREEAVPTALGPRTRWVVEERLEGGAAAQQTWYDEGVGWGPDTFGGSSAVLPLEPPESQVAWGPEVEAEAVTLPFDASDYTLSGVAAFTLSDGTTLLALDGRSSCFQDGLWQTCRHTWCLHHRGGALTLDTGEVVYDGHYEGTTCPTEQIDGSTFWGWGTDNNGVVTGAAVRHEAAAVGWVGAGHFEGEDGPAWLGLDLNEMGVSIRGAESSRPVLGLDQTFRTGALAGQIRLVGGADPARPDDWLTTNQGQVGLVRYDRDDGLAQPWTALGGLFGNLTGHRLPEGHELLATASDGAVDQIVPSDGRATRRPLARVVLPGREVAVAAVRLDDALLVFSHEFVDRVDHYANTLRAWRVDLPEAEPATPLLAPLGIQASWDGADLHLCWPQTDEALRTTGWTFGGEPAAEVLDLGGGCALALRDPPADLDAFNALLGERDPWWVDAPIPGVGAVRIALPPPSTVGLLGPPLHLQQPPAALADGTLVTRTYAYTDSGVLRGRPDHNVFGNNLHPARVDETGVGLWHPDVAVPTDNGPYRLLANLIRLGPGPSIDFGPQTAGWGVPEDIVATLPGGGVVLPSNRGGATYTAVYPDGTVLPMAQPFGVAPYMVAALDGPELCGLNQAQSADPTSLTCWDVHGDPRVIDLDTPRFPLGMHVTPGWLRLKDGTFLATVVLDQDQVVVRIDLSDGSVTEYMATQQLSGQRTPYGLWRDRHGDWWAVDRDAQGDHPVRLDPEGVVRFDLAQPWANPPAGNDARFAGIYPTDEVVLVHHRGNEFYRVPRSSLTPR